MNDVKPTLTVSGESDPGSGLDVGLAEFSRTILFGAALLAIVFGVAAVSLSRQYIEQDRQRIVENRALSAWQAVWPIWRHALQFPDVSPLTYTSFLIEARLWGTSRVNSAVGFKFVNLLVHALSVLALWHLLRRLELSGAWVAAALFGLHPAAIATAAWPSQRPVLLGTLLALLTLTVFLRIAGVNPAPETRHRLLRLPESGAALWVFCLGLAVLTATASPALACALWPVAVIVIWWEKGTLHRSDWLRSTPLATLSALVVAGVVYYVGSRGASGVELQQVPLFQRPIAAAQQLSFYLSQAVLPLQLRFAYAKFDMTATASVLSLLVLAIAGVGVVLLSRRWGRGVLAAAGLFVILMLPALVWVGRPEMFGGWVSVHQLYPALPVVTAGVSSAVAYLLFTRRELGVVTACVTLVAVGAAGIHQAWLYRSPARLWDYVLKHDPGHVAGTLRKAKLLESKGETSESVAMLTELIQANPNEIEPLVQLAAAELRNRRFDRARPLLLTALSKDPDHFEATYLLAQLLAMASDSERALAQYARALELRSADPRVHNDMGQLHFERGELDQARAAFEKAIRIDPQASAARINLANLLYQLGEVEAAGLQLTAVVQYDRENYEAFMNAGAMLGQAREFTKAAHLFRTAIAIRPERSDTYSNLAMALLGEAQDPMVVPERRLGLYSEAAFMFEKAAELNPANPDHLANARAARAVLEKLQAPAKRE